MRGDNGMELWLHDKIEGQICSVKINKVLHVEKSEYQEIAVVLTESYGKALILNGAIQVTEKDENFYHEMLVHVPMFTHPSPNRVLVIGGGDGGTVREVLKHPNVERVVMVEIDKRVVEVCKEFFPQLSCALTDPRLELLFEDGVKYVKETREKFDVVLVDSTDPYDFAEQLFSRDFFSSVFHILGDDGVCCSQTENPFIMGKVIKKVQGYLSELFKYRTLYWTVVPTYPGGLWTFSMGSKTVSPESFRRDSRVKTKIYSPELHRAVLNFQLPEEG